VVLADEEAAAWFDPASPPELSDFYWPLGRSTAARTHRVGVRFDGPDLAEAADRLALAPADLVAALCTLDLQVRFLGFLPGFAYLGPLPPALRLPRRDVPRPVVPAGSFAIAAQYAGIYPTASPGGWHLLGSARPPDVGAWEPGDRIALVAR
jgi:allophanate hydrolase subunit 1